MTDLKKTSLPFFLGLAVIIAGFACLRVPPVDSFWSLTAAPVLLVLGYVVLIPVGLWPRGRAGWLGWGLGRLVARRLAKA